MYPDSFNDEREANAKLKYLNGTLNMMYRKLSTGRIGQTPPFNSHTQLAHYFFSCQFFLFSLRIRSIYGEFMK